MTISKDLFLAILSLDSYNRSYGAGIAGLGGLGSKIGTATYSTDSETVVSTKDTAQTAGFYAVSYTVGAGVDDIDAGTTVISYRGTDAGADYWRGWSVSLGLTGIFTQTDETLAFYKAVTGKDYWQGAAANTIVTGHSLGGGLELR